jgi:hypothetical protein
MMARTRRYFEAKITVGLLFPVGGVLLSSLERIFVSLRLLGSRRIV